MVKTILMGIFIFIVSMGSWYFCFSFIAWEFNPKNWASIGRFLFAIFCPIISLALCAVAAGLDEIRRD